MKKEITLLSTQNKTKDWITFYPKFSTTHITFEPCSWDDWERPQIHFQLSHLIAVVLMLFLPQWFMLIIIPLLFVGWGDLYINLPFKVKRSCPHGQSTRYGYYFYKGENVHFSMWFVYGHKSKVIRMPIEYEWVRTSTLRKDGTWEHETERNRKYFYEDKWKDIIQYNTYDYKYTLKDGTVQNVKATIKTEEREWRMIWLKWTSKFNMVRRSIDITFNQEIGEGTGSWKGGVIGCGAKLLEGETPLECLRRMEEKRKF